MVSGLLLPSNITVRDTPTRYSTCSVLFCVTYCYNLFSGRASATECITRDWRPVLCLDSKHRYSTIKHLKTLSRDFSLSFPWHPRIKASTVSRVNIRYEVGRLCATKRDVNKYVRASGTARSWYDQNFNHATGCIGDINLSTPPCRVSVCYPAQHHDLSSPIQHSIPARVPCQVGPHPHSP